MTNLPSIKLVRSIGGIFDLYFKNFKHKKSPTLSCKASDGRGGRIRTCDLLLPKQDGYGFFIPSYYLFIPHTSHLEVFIVYLKLSVIHHFPFLFTNYSQIIFFELFTKLLKKSSYNIK